MLCWIAYIRSLNPVLAHINGKKNSMADMLSRAKYMCQDKIEAQEISDDYEEEDYSYVLVMDKTISSGNDLPFKEKLCQCRWRDIGIYLSILRRQEG